MLAELLLLLLPLLPLLLRFLALHGPSRSCCCVWCWQWLWCRHERGRLTTWHILLRPSRAHGCRLQLLLLP